MKKTSNTTNNTTETKSTMNAVKRAKSIVIFDKQNNATLVSVTNEDAENYKLANKKTVSRENALANISKNRYNSYTNEDNTIYKSYQSHVDCVKDVNALYELVKEIFTDATQTQYFVFANNKEIKLRIQRNAIEIMCEKLESVANAEQCSNSKDFAKYKYFVTATDTESVKKILESLK